VLVEVGALVGLVDLEVEMMVALVALALHQPLQALP
jgi:hypothetical protein